jgi:hypothetical protein
MCSGVLANIPQGLKPRTQFIGLIGTTKVVPCYKTTGRMSFSAAC